MIHPSDIPANHAIAVTAEGIIPYKEGDVVILGVKCWIDSFGNAVPFNEHLQLLRKELNKELGNDVYMFKRLNPEIDANTDRREPVTQGATGLTADR